MFRIIWECSSVGSQHDPFKIGVAGSIPATPTILDSILNCGASVTRKHAPYIHCLNPRITDSRLTRRRMGEVVRCRKTLISDANVHGVEVRIPPPQPLCFLSGDWCNGSTSGRYTLKESDCLITLMDSNVQWILDISRLFRMIG